jgi:hypothetical protein
MASWILLWMLVSQTAATIFFQETFEELCYSVNIRSDHSSVSGQYRRMSYQHWCDGQPVYRMGDTFLYRTHDVWRLGTQPCYERGTKLKSLDLGSKWRNADGKVFTTNVHCVTKTPLVVKDHGWTSVPAGSWGLESSQENPTVMGLAPVETLKDISVSRTLNLQQHQKTNPIIIQFKATLSSTQSSSAQLKLFPKSSDYPKLTSNSAYLLRFGPKIRIAGTRTEVHLELSFSLPGGRALEVAEKLSRLDGHPHTYHLHINPDKTVTAGVDGVDVWNKNIEGNAKGKDVHLVKQGEKPRNDHFAFVDQVGGVGFAWYSLHTDVLVQEVLVTDDIQAAQEHLESVLSRRATKDEEGEVENERDSRHARKRENMEELLLKMKKTLDEDKERGMNERREHKRQAEMQVKQLEVEASLMRLTEQALQQLNQARSTSADAAMHRRDHAVIALATVCQTVIILVLLYKLTTVGQPTLLVHEDRRNGLVSYEKKMTKEDKNNNMSQHANNLKLEGVRRRRNSLMRRSQSCDMSSGIQ